MLRPGGEQLQCTWSNQAQELVLDELGTIVLEDSPGVLTGLEARRFLNDVRLQAVLLDGEHATIGGRNGLVGRVGGAEFREECEAGAALGRHLELRRHVRREELV